MRHFAAILLLVSILNIAPAQDAISGRFYDKTTVRALVDKPIPNPSYLVGEFIYLPSDNEREDLKFFCTYSAPVNTDPFILGDIVLVVKFFNGTPALSLGKAIAPNESDPLIIRAVERFSDGKKIMILAESRLAK